MSIREVVKSTIALLISTGVAFGFIWLIIFFLRQQEQKEMQLIRSSPAFVQGVVTQKRSYKGRGMDILYAVNREQFELSTGITDSTYWRYEVGDSIELEYMSTDPSKAMIREKMTE